MFDISHATPELFDALAVAQGKIENAAKNANNPHFKSRYADLAEVLNTIRPPFSEQGLALIQSPAFDGSMVSVTTIVTHKSGGYITMTVSCVPAKSDAQGIGSATTYLRRYGGAAAGGIAQEDDDGNSSSHNGKPAPLNNGRPTDGAWDHISEEGREYLQKCGATAIDLWEANGVVRAHEYVAGLNLDSEEKIALWTLLPSQMRSALKKASNPTDPSP